MIADKNGKLVMITSHLILERKTKRKKNNVTKPDLDFSRLACALKKSDAIELSSKQQDKINKNLKTKMSEVL